MKRHFDIYDIIWVIDIINIETWPIDWSIYSPEFTIEGSNITKWLMRLESKRTERKRNERNNDYVFILKRCKMDAGPEHIYANWRLSICNQNNESRVLERFCIFSEGVQHMTILNNCEILTECFNSCDRETLTFKCKMILYTHISSKQFKPSNHKGKKCLSENLMDLLASSFKSDLAMQTSRGRIMAHRGIMSNRIKMFQQLIEEAPEDEEDENIDVIDFSNFPHGTVMSLVKYAYSGDLVHVLLEPSLSMYDLVKKLNVDYLLPYFVENTLTFRSRMNITERKYTWKIENFAERCNSLMRSPLVFDEFYNTWQCLFYPNYNYFSIFLYPIGKFRLVSNYLRILIYDETGNSNYEREMNISTTNMITKLGFGEFIQRDLLKSYVKNNTLCLSVRFIKTDVTSPMVHSSIDKYDHPVPTDIDEISSFDLLSTDMDELFENCDYHDVEFEINGDNYVLHRCILTTRSKYLAHFLAKYRDIDLIILKKLGRKLNVYTLLEVFNYFYTGVIKSETKHSLGELRQAAIFYDLPVLKELCDDKLANLK